MLTRHKGFQSAGQARRGKKELRPLRKIVDYRAGKEVLECGHEQWPRTDIAGDTNATRRRCIHCPKKDAATSASRPAGGAPDDAKGGNP